MTKKYICPYCYTKYNPIELGFSCKNNDCKKDFEYKNLKFLDQFYLGYIGLRPISKCPYCDESDIGYMCPNKNCIAKIPASLIRKNSPIISILGATDSGKTVYNLSLIKAISKTGVSFAPKTDMNKTIYGKMIENFSKGILPGRTNSIGDEERSMVGTPLIYDFNHKKSVLLSFYDSAGEDLKKMDSMKEYYKYIYASSAIILVMDVFTTDEYRENSLVVFYNFLQAIKEVKNIRENEKIKVPIVILFSKYDEVLNKKDKENVNKFKDNCKWDKLNTEETIECIDNLSSTLKHRLMNMESFSEAESFINTCDKTFTNYRFIPVASIALNDEFILEDKEQKFNIKTTESVNVELPFIYLLHQLNAI